jgi:hypothetical protein
MSAENWFLRSPSFTLDRLGAIPSPPLLHRRAAYSLAVYSFAIFTDAAFSGARAATEFLHLVNPKVHQRYWTAPHRSAFPEQMRLDYPIVSAFSGTRPPGVRGATYRHGYQWNSRRGMENQGTESIVSLWQRQFRPFQLFQHRHLRLLAVFSRKFSDLQFRTFGSSLALIQRAAKRRSSSWARLSLPEADQEARYEAQNRTNYRLRE